LQYAGYYERSLAFVPFLCAFDLAPSQFDSTDTRVSAPSPRFCHGFVSVGTRCLVVFGGSGAEQNTNLDSVHVLDTQTLRWTTLLAGSLPAASEELATMLDDGKATKEPSVVVVHKPSPRNGFSFVRLGNKIMVRLCRLISLYRTSTRYTPFPQ